MAASPESRRISPATGKVDRGLRALTLAAVAATFVLIVVGGIVRVTGSGLGCPDWPTCHGYLIPPPGREPWIEFSHRLVAGVVSVLVAAIVVAAWRSYRSHPAILRPALAAAGALIVQILLGAVTVVLELPPLAVWIHLGTALLVFACLIVVATNARLVEWSDGQVVERSDGRMAEGAGGRIEARLRSRILALALASAISILVLTLLGATVVNTGASLACPDWPLCLSEIVPPLSDPLVVVHFTHRFAALATGIPVLLFAVEARRVRAQAPRVSLGALILLGLFVAQIVVGGLTALWSLPLILRALHLAVAAAAWGVAVALAVVLARSGPVTSEVPAQERPGRAEPASNVGAAHPSTGGSAFKKYLYLTKPWIIALLLTTTLASMLIAGRGSVSLPLAAFTLIGGALASAGANAINCYVDRDIDGLMSRTKNRPIPRHQLDPRRALAFGLVASGASFAILLVFVNLLAATLAVFGIIYYVFVYTLWLKRSTPHNIVIGGIAGAVPPLVGWAAVTGRVDLLALYLFLIVFYWTPPHTWALAILVRGDYEKANVPMLPVVRGEAETRRHIWLYSLQMVAVTLLLFAFHMLGWVYLALALVLNGLFLWYAYRLTREMDKPAARRLYKFSQLYLALLFVAMVVDASALA
ncbi:MAG TPA: heme o synthase [Anaerolineae bacterium]|nr:heme o synthase [Anaerolineae bacterium]